LIAQVLVIALSLGLAHGYSIEIQEPRREPRSWELKLGKLIDVCVSFTLTCQTHLTHLTANICERKFQTAKGNLHSTSTFGSQRVFLDFLEFICAFFAKIRTHARPVSFRGLPTFEALCPGRVKKSCWFHADGSLVMSQTSVTSVTD
jgi:hypothetical protein